MSDELVIVLLLMQDHNISSKLLKLSLGRELLAMEVSTKGRRWVGIVFVVVFSLFPWGSQFVPNSTSILSHMVCPKFNSHVYKLKKVGNMGANFFPWFPTCSLQVPNGFPSGSQYVLQVPNVFSIAPHGLSQMLLQLLSSFHLYRWAKGEELYTSK